MARPVDPSAQYRIKPHVTHGYTYASTHRSFVDPETGRKTYRHFHWGTIDEKLKFIPGKNYYLAAPAERARLVFPSDWDMSEADKLNGLKTEEWPSRDHEGQNRLYGDIWLLERIAVKTGIRQDLETVFQGNREIVDDILTLAMFSYLTNYTYNRVARWQRIVKAPSCRELTFDAITRLTQSITERHRMEILKLRALRLEEDEFCAVDSTSGSAYGQSLTDIRWGKNKELLPLEQTTEVVVYALSSHMPVYYRTFPGNTPDSRSLEARLKDLELAGFNKNLVFIADRGYESARDLEQFIIRGQPMIMCGQTSQTEVAKAINELGDFDSYPKTMTIDPVTKLYYKRYDLEREIAGARSTMETPQKLKMILYFDPTIRDHELRELDMAISLQKTALNEMIKNKSRLEDEATIKLAYYCYKVVYNRLTRVIQSFELNEKKVAKARCQAGFFSIITHGLDFDAMKILHTYQLRDEHEEYFQRTREQMAPFGQRNRSEAGETGRHLILFVSLVLSSYARRIWKNTNTRNIFSSSLDMIDEMRSIRCIERPNHDNAITPFMGAQLDICKAFGFEIPEESSPTRESDQKFPRKKGDLKKS
ncbi:MAG: transposase [Deltaproteobacteria bacterium]|jgi:transposase|nr:transposase [Deltaproteobacteria bacterium]